MNRRILRHPVLGDLPRRRVVTISVDGEPVAAREGEPVAVALLAAGRRVLRHTDRFGEPRGLFCAIGRCTDCAMTVDGRPNVRTCITPVREGMVVVSPAVPLSLWERGYRGEGHSIPETRNPEPPFVAVVGSGPAGLCAAIEAARAGARVVLLDENDRPGGQLFKQIHRFFGTSEHQAGRRGFEIGRQLLDEVRELGVDVRLSTTVWGAFQGPVLGCATSEGGSYLLRPDRLILATGASERVIRFPGWTLPGVMGAGAAQTLANLHRVLPGRRVLMVGSGNVGLIVSFQLIQAGAQVAAIVEAAPRVGGWEVHAARVRRAGTPILTRHTILGAFGREEVEGAVIAQLEGNGRPAPGTERRLKVDLVCLAVGLRPQTQLAGMLGLHMADDPVRGGLAPVRDENLRSSNERVYVVGDLGAIAEASTAMEEGRIAGIAAAQAIIPRRSPPLPLGEGPGVRDAVPRVACDPCLGGEAGVREAQARLALLQREVLPSARSRLQRVRGGPVAVIECDQAIPCNPCEAACRRGAIRIGPDPMQPPDLDAGRCTGCLRCLRECPGMAIFVVNAEASRGEATIAMPWELLPLPQAGQQGRGLDRSGRSLCPARVVRVLPFRQSGDTAIVTVAVPLQYANRVRGFGA